MKPNQISEIMEIAYRARKKGLIFNPLFVGPPGVGKTEIIQQWAKNKNIPTVIMSLATYDAPDFKGFPNIQTVDGRQRLSFAIPEVFPTSGEGVIVLEELNRAPNSIMQCILSLGDSRRGFDGYTLPEGWMIVASINPENEKHDVNSMDSALKDRFEMFQVSYDKTAFVDYMKNNDWSDSIINFVKSSAWSYVSPEKVSETGNYVSPRTWSKVNAAEKAEIPDTLKLNVYTSILGNNVGKSYFNFACEDAPVSYEEILTAKRSALKRIASHSDIKNYQADKLSVTVNDIIDNAKEGRWLDDEVLVDVLMNMAAEQGYTLLREYTHYRQKMLHEVDFHKNILKKYPELKKLHKSQMMEEK